VAGAASENAATGSATAGTAAAGTASEKCPITEAPSQPAPPPEPVCNNKELTAYDGLLVLELPTDADYGKPSQLCLPERLYRGDQAAKLKAVRSHGSQIGLVRQTGVRTPARMGLMDCTGYLASFVHRTEVFVPTDPRASPRQ
jgi:hypothetical protein